MKDLQTDRDLKLKRLGENVINAKLHAKKRREADRRIVSTVRRLMHTADDKELIRGIVEAIQTQDPTLEEFNAEVDKLNL